MKRTTLTLLAGIVLFLSACSLETYPDCSAYSGQYKITPHGQKAQVRYAKRNIRKYGVISSTL
jgi:hypothetical protein